MRLTSFDTGLILHTRNTSVLFNPFTLHLCLPIFKMSKRLIYSIFFLFFACQGHAQMFWKPYGVPTDALSLHSSVLHSKATGKLYVTTWNMGIFSSPDQGQTWDHVLQLPKEEPVLNITELKNGMLVGGGKGKIYRSKDGDKWEEIVVPISYVKQITEDKNGNIYICSTLAEGIDEGIFKSEDLGNTWQPLNEGLSSKFVYNLFVDANGNLLCSLSDNYPDCLFIYDEGNKQWKALKIYLTFPDGRYRVDNPVIKAITGTKDSLYISFIGVIGKVGIQGVIKNSISGVINETDWIQEMANPSTPLTSIVDQLLITKEGNMFGSVDIPAPVLLYNKMHYLANWSSIKEGIDPRVAGLAVFCELPDGSVVLSASNNQLYITHEGVPGRKTQQISFDKVAQLRLYDETVLKARSSSNIPVSFKSSSSSLAQITGNQLRAVGLGRVGIKAYTPATDEYYYAEAIQSVSISKAANTIEVAPVSSLPEASTGIELKAVATSGEAVEINVISGAAHLTGNHLVPDGAGPVVLRFTEPGNGSYAQADTVFIQICVNPNKPTLTVQSNTGQTVLVSGSNKGNNWFLNDHLIKTGDDSILRPTDVGIYQVQVNIGGCISEMSESIVITTIDNGTEDRRLKVYPIPFRDEIFIENHDQLMSNAIITLFNIGGQEMWKQASIQGLTRIYTGNFSPGVYFITIKSKTKSRTFRLLKQ